MENTVFVVRVEQFDDDNESYTYNDSVWSTKEQADKRAEVLSKNWGTDVYIDEMAVNKIS